MKFELGIIGLKLLLICKVTNYFFIITLPLIINILLISLENGDRNKEKK